MIKDRIAPPTQLEIIKKLIFVEQVETNFLTLNLITVISFTNERELNFPCFAKSA